MATRKKKEVLEEVAEAQPAEQLPVEKSEAAAEVKDISSVPRKMQKFLTQGDRS